MFLRFKLKLDCTSIVQTNDDLQKNIGDACVNEECYVDIVLLLELIINGLMSN